MFPLLSLLAVHSPPSALIFSFPAPPLLRLHRRRSLLFPVKHSISGRDQSPFRATYVPQNQQPPRTLFPGGYKRPEIKVPSLILQLEPDEVLNQENGALDLIDKAVSKFVGAVVLNDSGGSGGAVYEAALLLKSIVKDRAYLLVAERVDIAAAVGASGVILSDRGLPAVVARNTMMDSRSDSVFLPLVARSVRTKNAALNASSSEGADFLIYDLIEEEHTELAVKSVFESVKIPIFVLNNVLEATLQWDASNLLNSGASGLVVALEDLRFSRDDLLNQLFKTVPETNKKRHDEVLSVEKDNLLGTGPDSYWEMGVAGFVKLEDKEKQLIEKEKLVLHDALDVFQKAAPLMEEVSLLVDAIAQIDEPFLLVIVGEFNSGKSTVINAILGERYLKDGVVPTTNEITFLRYSELNDEDQQRCQRHPDGQLICYLRAPILKQIHIVDTPGTNVILQRQQRLTEEFVPRADLLIFVISADRPLTESEVAFLRYTQQWKKKVVFVLNKADLYRNTHELEEAMSFIKENTRKLLNIDQVTLYPLSARSVLDEKLSSCAVGRDYKPLSHTNLDWRTSSFYEFENFLYSFLDGSSSTGMERVKLKLETPMAIADRLLSACEVLVGDERQYAEKDLALANGIVHRIENYVMKMENESISWMKRILRLFDTTKSRVVELIQSAMQLSNLDLVMTYALKGESSPSLPATLRVQNDIIGPALSDAEAILGEYEAWLQSNNVREGRLCLESFENRWPSLEPNKNSNYLERHDLLRKLDQRSLRVMQSFSATEASKSFEQEIREVFVGTFGGLGAAGLSASLLTSVLPTIPEDLLALVLCSAGGYIAISRFPGRRQGVIEKVDRRANALAQELEAAMLEDLKEAVTNLEQFVKAVGKPYQDAARNRVAKLLKMQYQLSNVGEKLSSLKIEIQNIHVS